MLLTASLAACSDDDGSGGAGPSSAPTTTTSSIEDVVDPAIGATGVGDEYFPDLGNGGYDVGRYVLAIDVDPASGTIAATATIEATATEDLGGFHLDFNGLDLGEVTVDGRPARTSRDDGELLVEPSEAISDGAGFVTVVEYSGAPEPVVSDALGPVGWTTLPDGSSYVLSEPEGASTWFPANDHPSDKALFRFELTTPDGIEAAANGLLVGRDSADGGRTEWVYEVAHPMAPYLATVAIGDFVFEEFDSPAGVPIRNVYDEDLAAEAAAAFSRQGEMIDLFDDLFGPYPFEVYGALVMNASMGVAMETQTMSLFGVDVIGVSDFGQQIIAHELAHQWFGDSVSLDQWQDIWLNEGFATYAQWLWAEHDRGTPIDDLAREAHARLAGTGNGDLPPGDPGPDEMFSISVYERGALALYELRRRVGDDAFFTTLQRWASERADGNGTTEEFIALAEAVAGADLGDLFDAWLYAEELPDLSG